MADQACAGANGPVRPLRGRGHLAPRERLVYGSEAGVKAGRLRVAACSR